jgi:hypothetical protein
MWSGGERLDDVELHHSDAQELVLVRTSAGPPAGSVSVGTVRPWATTTIPPGPSASGSSPADTNSPGSGIGSVNPIRRRASRRTTAATFASRVARPTITTTERLPRIADTRRRQSTDTACAI